uniref:NADH dehydrogenase [ubiquinone] 1 beta subcomplex subunit 9 n=1 Tax=Hucho hucho TaxID=62062 RepID=A0A4W5RIS4_9TELE
MATAYLTHNQNVLRLYKKNLRGTLNHGDEKDMVKATMMLKAGEEAFGSNPQYEMYKVSEWCLDHWHPSETAMYPDYFAKREQWKKLSNSCRKETPAIGPKSEALPPARKDGDLPPLWWQYVTRPRERPV